MRNDETAYFPSTYQDGRAAFIQAAEAAGLEITTRVHDSQKSPTGRPLFMDVACAGDRDAKRALFLISGTHGVEGYFGSGVQTGLLREGIASHLPKGVKLVLLHALNPFGFAWDRRVNEDNADINRNFIDHASPPQNPAYETLAQFIAPKAVSEAALIAANAHLEAYADAHGDFALQSAISSGQYSHADGLYFGGTKESWSSRMLHSVIEEHLRGVQKMVVMDYHTGLGESGAAEIISEDAPHSPAFQRQNTIWGKRARTTSDGSSLSAPLTGTLDKALARWLPPTELTCATLEIGTAPTPAIFNALRRDNWLHLQNKPDHSLWTAIKQEIRAAFYPDNEGWKRKAWTHARETAQPALAFLR